MTWTSHRVETADREPSLETSQDKSVGIEGRLRTHLERSSEKGRLELSMSRLVDHRDPKASERSQITEREDGIKHNIAATPKREGAS